MSNLLRSAAACCFVVLAAWPASFALGQSKPAAGTQATSFKVFGVTGPIADKDATLAEAPVKHSQVYFFVAADCFDRPIARYLKTVDQKVSKGIENVKDVDLFAVWLTDTPRKSRDYLPKAQQSLQFGLTTLVVLDGGVEGPSGWGVDSAAHLTVVLVRDGKIVESFAYRSVNETDTAELIAALQKQ